jgi:anti-sigma factor RsiW
MTGQRRITEAELHAFVDGELAPAEQAEIEALLVAAPAHLALVRELSELNDAIRERYADRLTAPVPEAVEAQVAGFGRGGTRKLERRLTRYAAAALLLIGAAAGGYTARGMLGEPHGAEAAFVETALGAHSVYVPEVRHPVEVKAGEAHLVRWLAKRVGADVRAPALAGLGWTLMGGRLLPDQDGHPAAQFMYEDGSGRRLTLYLRKETGLDNTSFRFFERDGFGAFYWIDRPLAYALTGRLSREELTTLADVVYGQLDGPPGTRAPAAPADTAPADAAPAQ